MCGCKGASSGRRVSIRTDAKAHGEITLQRVLLSPDEGLLLIKKDRSAISNAHSKARSCLATATPPIGFWRYVMTAVPHHPLSAEPMNTEEPRHFHVPCPISAHLATHRRTRDRHLGAVAGRVGLAATPPPSPGQSVTGRPCCPARLPTTGPTGSVLATLTLQTRGTGTAPPPRRSASRANNSAGHRQALCCGWRTPAPLRVVGLFGPDAAAAVAAVDASAAPSDQVHGRAARPLPFRDVHGVFHLLHRLPVKTATSFYLVLHRLPVKTVTSSYLSLHHLPSPAAAFGCVPSGLGHCCTP